jgi:DNA modification methylase
MIIRGDALTELRKLPDESVHCCVTSPPYWGLRDYGTAQWEGGDASCDHDTRGQKPGSKSDSNVGSFRNGISYICPRCSAHRIDSQLGLERTPEEYVARLVDVFREVKRVLKKDGTLWLNLGDAYNGGGRGGRKKGSSKQATNIGSLSSVPNIHVLYLKPKDLIGLPWRVAFALQADGWYLRSDIIWAKPNPMPESVTDRPTKSHEYIFLMSKSARYWYDAEAIKENLAQPERYNHQLLNYDNPRKKKYGKAPNSINPKTLEKHRLKQLENPGRNIRSVWTISTKPFKEAHFATFPPELPERCIKAGCPAGGRVLDPFFGAGTVGLVAKRMGREFIGIELNPTYCEMAEKRVNSVNYQMEIEANP